MANIASDNVDYRLLNSLSKLVICSHCLQKGTVTLVPQIISPARKITNVCARCRDGHAPQNRRKAGKLIPFPHG